MANKAGIGQEACVVGSVVEAGFELHPELRVFELVGGGEIEIIIGLDKLKDQMWEKWIKKLKPVRLRF